MATTGKYSWHPRLIEAATALHENRLDVAERLLKPHLKEDPFDAKAIRMLAELAWRIGRMRDAENLLRRAIEIAPGFTAARAQLALVLGRMGRPAEALPLLDQLFEQDGEQVGHLNLKAATVARLGDFDEAIQLYEGVLAKAHNQPRVWMSYGHMLKTVGRQAEGIDAYRKAIELQPALGEAWFSLANLKTVKFDDADVAAMRSALAGSDLSDEDRFHLDFAMGKAMHDAGHTDEAFAHFAEGNALRRKGQPYDSTATSEAVDKAIKTFSREAFAERRGGCDAPDPIFIVGMDDCVHLADVAEELVAEAFALRRALHQPCDIDERQLGWDDLGGAGDGRQPVEPRIGNRDLADVRLDRAKGIVGRLRRLRLGQRVEEGRLADVRQADDTAFKAHGSS